jgi:hypothetical protein
MPADKVVSRPEGRTEGLDTLEVFRLGRCNGKPENIGSGVVEFQPRLHPLTVRQKRPEPVTSGTVEDVEHEIDRPIFANQTRASGGGYPATRNPSSADV